MAISNGSKVLITGATGFVGSHLASALSSQLPNVILKGTTRSLNNSAKITQFKNAVCKYSSVELHNADMFQNRHCFDKTELLQNTDYVFHTAAPLITTNKQADAEDQIKMYCEATQNLVEAAIRYKVKKVVMIGAASSVIGQHPVTEENFVYSDPMVWVDPKTISKPNERAKLLSEKHAWNAIKKQNPQDTIKTNLVTLLPYFIIGKPLYPSIIETNSSCQAINAILDKSQYGFPEVMLPMVDVQDIA